MPADALADLGVIPKAAAKTIWDEGQRSNVRRRQRSTRSSA